MKEYLKDKQMKEEQILNPDTPDWLKEEILRQAEEMKSGQSPIHTWNEVKENIKKKK